MRILGLEHLEAGSVELVRVGATRVSGLIFTWTNAEKKFALGYAHLLLDLELLLAALKEDGNLLLLLLHQAELLNVKLLVGLEITRGLDKRGCEKERKKKATLVSISWAFSRASFWMNETMCWI